MSEEIQKAVPADAGCWIDGHWGQYAVARLVEIGWAYGWVNDVIRDIADRHLFQCAHPGSEVYISDDEHETLSDAADEVAQWLNDNVAPDGYYFEWYEGEFFLRASFAVLAKNAGLNPLSWRGQELVGHVWEETPVPEGGEQVYMGTLGMMTASQYETPDAFEVPVTAWGDYCNGGVERSNYRSLLRDMPDTFVEVLGGYNSQYLAIPADYAGDDAEDLINMMTGLREQYPLYDEEDHSMLELELADEAWDEWLASDVLIDLARDHNVDTDRVDEDQLREDFYRLVSEGDEYPYLESADSIVFPRQDEIVAELAESLPKCEEED